VEAEGFWVWCQFVNQMNVACGCLEQALSPGFHSIKVSSPPAPFSSCFRFISNHEKLKVYVKKLKKVEILCGGGTDDGGTSE